MSAGTDGNINIGLNLTTDRFNKQLKGIKGTVAKAAAGIAAAFTVRAMANFSKQCLELGSDLQEVQNVVDTTFTSMSDRVNKFAQNAAKSYGLSETMAKRYTGTFGAMAKAFGYGEAEAYKMSTTLTGLAGDVASFYNLSQDEAYTKLKSVFTGETESLKDLGVVMTQTALDQYALANGFGKTTAAMTEAEKVSLRYAFVTNQLKDAAGDFIRTQNSWANQTRILSLQVESFKAAIGQGLINILTPVIKWINLLMEKLVAAANAFKSFTETLFGKQGASKQQVTADTAEGLGTVADNADNATAATNKTAEAAKKLKRELAGFDQITKLGSEEESADTSSTPATAPSTPITTPTPGGPSENDVDTLTTKYKNLATAIGTLKSKFKSFTDLLSGAGKWVMDNVLKPLGEWTMNTLLPGIIDTLASAFEFLTTALGFLKPVWDWAWEYLLQPIANFVGDALIIVLNSMKGAFELLTTALTVLKPIWDWAWKNFFEPIGKFVGTAITGFLSDLAEKLNTVPESLLLLKTAIESIPKKIEETKAKVKEKWDELKANITGKVVDFKAQIATKWDDLKAAWNKLKSNASGKTADFKAKIASKWNDLKAGWNSIKDNIKGKTAEMKAKIATKWKSIKSGWTSITDNIKNKTASMKAKVGSKWSDLKKSWNNLLGNFKDKTVSVTLNIAGKVADIKKWFNENVIDKVNEKIHKVPLLKSVTIPHLAQGGFVKKNTPQLAMIGDNRHYGEIVAPENKLEEMARMAAAGAMGTSPEVIALLREIVELLKNLDLDVVVDGKSLMAMIVRLINNQTKSTGRCPIKV